MTMTSSATSSNNPDSHVPNAQHDDAKQKTTVKRSAGCLSYLPRKSTVLFTIWSVILLTFPWWYGDLADPYGLRVYCLYGICKQKQADRGYKEGTYAGDRDERYLVCLSSCEKGCDLQQNPNQPKIRGLLGNDKEITRIDHEKDRWDVAHDCEKQKKCEMTRVSSVRDEWRDRIISKDAGKNPDFRQSWRLDAGWEVFRRWRKRYKVKSSDSKNDTNSEESLGVVSSALTSLTAGIKFLPPPQIAPSTDSHAGREIRKWKKWEKYDPDRSALTKYRSSGIEVERELIDEHFFKKWTRSYEFDAIHLVPWNCRQECQYGCWTENHIERYWRRQFVLKYYGRWPFLRVWGINEFASVVLSFMNMIPCLIGWWVQVWKLWDERKRKNKSGGNSKGQGSYRNPIQLQHLKASIMFFLLGSNTWLQSAIFHAAENPTTTLLDTMSVQIGLGYCLIYGCLLHGFASNWQSKIFTAGRIKLLAFCLILFVGINFGTSLMKVLVPPKKGSNVDRISGEIDFEQELEAGNSFLVHVGMVLGALAGLVILSVPWMNYGISNSSTGSKNPLRPILRKAALYICLFGAYPFAIVFEIYDFPPVFGFMDSHAMWHLGTVPLQAFWLILFEDIEECLGDAEGEVDAKNVDGQTVGGKVESKKDK